MHVFLPAGIYEIVNSHSTQLAYKLQLPEAPGKVQEELHIGAEGTFKVSIKVRGVLTAICGWLPQLSQAAERHLTAVCGCT